ncbi:MAG: hypothetical protein JEZ05_00450 [Tenericutes bacterium]|nr:hypothetical protein [Mycoplasmatota bacterium]
MKKGILIKRKSDGKKLEIKLVDLHSDKSVSELHQIYKLLEVSLIDVVEYKGMSIYVDDEGLLKDDPKLTMHIKDRNQCLFGNLLILGSVNDEGETMGITKDDATAFCDSKIFVHPKTERELIAW